MENSLRLKAHFSQIGQSEICTEVSFPLPEPMWMHEVEIILHRSEILLQSEISNWFEFTSGFMKHALSNYCIS